MQCEVYNNLIKTLCFDGFKDNILKLMVHIIDYNPI